MNEQIIVDNFNRQMALILSKLAVLYRRQGWKALNYSSWDECVKAEFQMTAAEIEELWQDMPEHWKKENLADCKGLSPFQH